MSKKINKKASELEITVSADAKEWKDEQNKAEKIVLSKVQVKGFRKGKVPVNVAKKHISKADIFSEAIKKMLDELIKVAAKEIKDEMILSAPTYAVEQIDENILTVKFIYPIYPEIIMPDYKKLGTKFKEEPVKEKAVEDELQKILSSKTKEVEKNGKIEKGDIAEFDFEGFVEGKPFEGGKAEKHKLEIGSGQFIPGFEDQMVGLEKGAETDIKVTFPNDYQAPNLKGKEAQFKIKIHNLHSKIKPEMGDSLVKELGIKNVETVEQLKKYIKNVFTEQARQESRAKFQRESFDKILSQVEVNVPAQLIAQEMQNLSKNFEQQLKQQNMNIEQYMKFTGTDKVKLDAQFKQQAEARLRDSFIFAEIAKIEKINLTDRDYENEYKKLAKVYQQTEEGIKGVITKEQMQIPMTNDRVIDKLIEFNN